MAQAAEVPPVAVIGRLVDALVATDYDGALRQAPRSRVVADDLRVAMEQYGRRLITPPHYDLVDAIRVETANLPTWSVVVPLFTAEEGRSDLSLELTMIEATPGEWAVEVDGLHVL